MRHDEYLRHDATALADLVRRGEVSPHELLDLARAQAERVQPRLNAVTRWLPALAEAQLAHGAAGPLGGVPFVVKDSVADVAGVPTSYGSRAGERLVPPVHAAVLRRLLDAGATVFAKTNLPEFGLKGVSDSRAFGPVRNPWDPARHAGGSSGGSAAAVAAGVVPMAGGNDGGGSLRIPAAFCGLFALKPSRGRISNGPGLGEVWFGACSEGVISRSVRDSALALDILCGPEPGDPFTGAAPAEPFVAALHRPPARLRVAFSTASPLGTAVDAEAAAAVQAAARRLEALGHHVEEAAPPVDGHAVAACYLQLYAAQVPAVMAQARALGARDTEFEPLTRVMAAYGQRLGGATLTAGLARWNGFARTLGAFFTAHDVWLTPTTARPALPLGALEPSPAEARLTDLLLASGLLAPLARWGALDTRVQRLFVQNLAPYPFTQLANLAGVPAMSLPLHRTPEGLPLGVQAVGRQGDEATLLQLAAELEADAPWFDRLPPIASGSAAQ